MSQNIRSSPAREALDFIVDTLTVEAGLRSISLSDTELQMLCFSETAPTLNEMSEVAEDFDCDYDPTAYERKVADLVMTARERLDRDDPAGFTKWRDATHELGKHDYYLNVMIAQAVASRRTPGNALKLGGSAVLIAGFLLAVMYYWMKRS